MFVNHTTIAYWERSGITNRANPWQWSKNKCAPFDTEFYLILNVAVGGTIFFTDGVGNKPWNNWSKRAAEEFYETWVNGIPHGRSEIVLCMLIGSRYGTSKAMKLQQNDRTNPKSIEYS